MMNFLKKIATIRENGGGSRERVAIGFGESAPPRYEPGALCFSPENILLCSEGPAQICTSVNATVTTHNPRASAFVARDEPEWQIEFPPDNEMAVDAA